MHLPCLDPSSVADTFASHVAALGGAGPRFVCGTRFAAESWFQVELAAALVTLGIDHRDIEFSWPIGQRQSVDLRVGTPDGPALVELKCFVSGGGDGQKRKEFPKQVARLEAAVRSGVCVQGIAVVMLHGYPDPIPHFLQTSLAEERWDVTPPRRLLRESTRLLVVASTK